MNATPEKPDISATEAKKDESLDEIRDRQQEKIKDNQELSGEKLSEDREKSLEKARQDVLDETGRTDREKAEVVEERQPSPAERRGPIGKVELEASFNSTMDDVQSQMTASSRAFSKVIHNKVVEKTSEVVGTTVARPNALLSGAIFAFILTLAVYLVAKNIGFQLSGFESISAFIIGWALGLMYDFLKVMITGRK